MFSQEQLDFIKKCAEYQKDGGEFSVYTLAHRLSLDGFFWEGFDTQQDKIIKFCAEECERQHSGEMSVYDMVNAWDFADTDAGIWMLNEGKVNTEFIERVGILVEPIDNKNGFRTIPIGVTDGMGGWIEKANWEDVPRLLTLLLESYYEGNLVGIERGTYIFKNNLLDDGSVSTRLSPEDEFYYQFENIHPFVDGNGRTGKILYNYLLGSLNEPKMPPNFWGGSNP